MSEWNKFQKECAGKGMNRAEVSAAYHARSGGGSSSASSSYSRPTYSTPSYSAPPPAPSRPTSSWNQFQRETAGQGLSQSEKSAHYHARNTATSSSSSTPPPRQTRASVATTSSSTWNQYQRDHAGQGLSPAEMSSGYRAQQAASGTSSGSAAERRAAAANAAATRAAASASVSAPAAASKSSTWNQYQRDHAGEGLSRAEMSLGYRAELAAKASSTSTTQRTASAAERRAAAATAATKRATTTETTTPTAAKPKAATSSASVSTWNEFQRQHAGQDFTKRQLSLLYKEHKKATATTTATSSASARATATVVASATTATKSTRRPNAFNEFQKQYKKAHPNEKLSAPQLAKLYRQQQQQELRTALEEGLVEEWNRTFDHLGGAHDYFEEHDQAYAGFSQARDASVLSNVFDHAQEEYEVEKRDALEHFMLELAKQIEQLRQQVGAPCEEIDELMRVAETLEAEEGNLNRKAFVHSHQDEFAITLSLDCPKAHAKRATALSQCEVIDASRLQLTMDDASRIGSGGCGVVYSALLDNETPVAVKVIDGVTTKSKDRFEQELLAMMKASTHEHVLRVLGYSVFADRPGGRQTFGIAMELMGGGDLAYVMHCDETVTLTQTDRLCLLVQVIKAIEHIHAQDITHRDIKPHNVLLSTDLQTAKLADFGLAGFKNMTLSTRQSQVGSTKGVIGLTPTYAAPEVINGELSFRDAAWKKSDVFSFTVMLTEAVMREQPWEFESPQFILNAVSKQQKRPFDEADMSLSGSTTATTRLRSLVRDGWQQDPSMRPSATEVRERLEKIIAEIDGVSAAASKASHGNSSPRSVDAVGSSTYSYLYPERRANRGANATVHNGTTFYDAE